MLTEFQKGKKKVKKPLMLTREDYKIFYRDLSTMNNLYTIPEDLMPRTATHLFSGDEGGGEGEGEDEEGLFRTETFQQPNPGTTVVDIMNDNFLDNVQETSDEVNVQVMSRSRDQTPRTTSGRRESGRMEIGARSATAFKFR